MATSQTGIFRKTLFLSGQCTEQQRKTWRTFFTIRFPSSYSSELSSSIRCLSSQILGRKKTTEVYAFGDNTHGAIGIEDISTPNAPEPQLLRDITSDCSAVFAGHYHSFAVTLNGKVFVWGRNSEHQLGRSNPTPKNHVPSLAHFPEAVELKKCTGSGVASMAICSKGVLWSWGASKRGQLGLGSGTSVQHYPSKINGDLSSQFVKQVALGWGHGLALTQNGDVYSWGYAADFRLGHSGPVGNVESTPSLSNLDVEKAVAYEMAMESKLEHLWEPKKIKEFEDVKMSSISCGMDHSLALANDGRLFCFGDNSLGQLGRFSSNFSPTGSIKQIPGTFEIISAGLSHSLAYSSLHGHKTYLWGTKVGCPDFSDLKELKSIEGLDGVEVKKMAAGRAHSCVLSKEGELFLWGSGNSGRLGFGGYRDEKEPMFLEFFEGKKVLDVACGFDHTLVLVEA